MRRISFRNHRNSSSSSGEVLLRLFTQDNPESQKRQIELLRSWCLAFLQDRTKPAAKITDEYKSLLLSTLEDTSRSVEYKAYALSYLLILSERPASKFDDLYFTYNLPSDILSIFFTPLYFIRSRVEAPMASLIELAIKMKVTYKDQDINDSPECKARLPRMLALLQSEFILLVDIDKIAAYAHLSSLLAQSSFSELNMQLVRALHTLLCLSPCTDRHLAKRLVKGLQPHLQNLIRPDAADIYACLLLLLPHVEDIDTFVQIRDSFPSGRIAIAPDRTRILENMTRVYIVVSKRTGHYDAIKNNLQSSIDLLFKEIRVEFFHVIKAHIPDLNSYELQQLHERMLRGLVDLPKAIMIDGLVEIMRETAKRLEPSQIDAQITLVNTLMSGNQPNMPQKRLQALLTFGKKELIQDEHIQYFKHLITSTTVNTDVYRVYTQQLISNISHSQRRDLWDEFKSLAFPGYEENENPLVQVRHKIRDIFLDNTDFSQMQLSDLCDQLIKQCQVNRPNIIEMQAIMGHSLKYLRQFIPQLSDPSLHISRLKTALNQAKHVLNTSLYEEVTALFIQMNIAPDNLLVSNELGPYAQFHDFYMRNLNGLKKEIEETKQRHQTKRQKI